MSTLIPEGYLSPADLDRLREKLAAEATHLVTRSDGPLSDDEARRVDELEDALRTINVRVQQLDLIARSVDNSTNLSGDGTTVRSFNINHSRDPWTDGGSIANSAPLELRDRALTALERSECTDEGRDNVDRALRSDKTTTTARHILAVSNPEYEDLFRGWLRNPNAHVGWTDAQRAAFRAADEVRTTLMESNTGAYLVPFTLDPTIRLTNNGAINPMRQLADVRTIVTDDWNGVTSAGVTAEWLGEGSEAADATPTNTQVTVTARKAAAYLEASYELAQDSSFPDQVGRLMADAKDRLEADAFMTGSGTDRPYGVITRLAATTASRVAGSSGSAGAADLVVADVYNVANALPPRYRQNSAWLGEQTTLNEIRSLGTTYGSSFWADLGVAQPSTLLGRPVYEASALDSTVVSGSNDDVLVLGDFSQGYVIADRLGMALSVNPHVVGASGRPVAKYGYFAYWRVGGDLIDTNAARVLRL